MAPQLRGLVQRSMVRDIGQAIGLAFVAGFAWRYFYSEPKRKRYEDFYKNFDAEKAAKVMEAEMADAQS